MISTAATVSASGYLLTKADMGLFKESARCRTHRKEARGGSIVLFFSSGRLDQFGLLYLSDALERSLELCSLINGAVTRHDLHAHVSSLAPSHEPSGLSSGHGVLDDHLCYHIRARNVSNNTMSLCKTGVHHVLLSIKSIAHLLPHRRSTSLLELGSLLTLLVHTLRQQRSILVRGILGGLGGSSLQCNTMSLVLHALRGDESLDLGGLGVGLFAFSLGGDFATNDELAIDNILTCGL